MNTINSTQLPSPPPLLNPAMDAGKADGASFKNMLFDSIREVNTMQLDADAAVEQMFTGGDVNPAEVLTAANLEAAYGRQGVPLVVPASRFALDGSG